MNVEIAKKICALRDADLKLRDELIEQGRLSEGYDPEMEDLHNKNAEILDGIINDIGYPTAAKVGKEACEAAWLVIQHSISQPSFMRKCKNLLELAVKENQADKKSLAYLTDRIAVLSGEPQKYGTQFDWDESGKLVPNLYDDLNDVNLRRSAIGLNTLEKQTALINQRVKEEHQLPPDNLAKRNASMIQWKIKVGWL